MVCCVLTYLFLANFSPPHWKCPRFSFHKSVHLTQEGILACVFHPQCTPLVKSQTFRNRCILHSTLRMADDSFFMMTILLLISIPHHNYNIMTTCLIISRPIFAVRTALISQGVDKRVCGSLNVSYQDVSNRLLVAGVFIDWTCWHQNLSYWYLGILRLNEYL